MYYRHFNLSGPPFQFTPSAGVLYPSKSHQEAMAALEWGLLHEPSGLTLLIGEPGTGKTTLISSVLARHFEHVRIAYVGNPKLTFDEILQVIARQLGIVFRSEQRLARLDAIDHFLETHRSERVTVVIDEAQVLADAVVEELRLLSNYSPARQTALRFVFVGQPEFLHRLESPGLKQVNERIGARAMLNPLQPNEIYEYIDYRLRARKGAAKDIFASAALKLIAENCGGIPRRINVLCHNAMLLAYTSGSKRVRAQHAKAAAAEYDSLFTTNSAHPAPEPMPRSESHLWQAAAAVAALGAAAIGAAYLWSLNSLHYRDYGVRSTAALQVKPVATIVREPSELISRVTASLPRPDSSTALAATEPMARASEAKAKQAVHEIAAAEHHLKQIRVKIGDTVEDIAHRYMGSKEDLAAVAAANPQLSDINRIYPGDVVYVPEPDSQEAAER
jgi:type II secretory pathway predicted ATPase ExeA/phage tail protein X